MKNKEILLMINSLNQEIEDFNQMYCSIKEFVPLTRLSFNEHYLKNTIEILLLIDMKKNILNSARENWMDFKKDH
jgi:hypothetical protein